MQRLYSPAAINVDFALITLKTPVTEGTGFFGIQRGTGETNIDISSVRSVAFTTWMQHGRAGLPAKYGYLASSEARVQKVAIYSDSSLARSGLSRMQAQLASGPAAAAWMRVHVGQPLLCPALRQEP